MSSMTKGLPVTGVGIDSRPMCHGTMSDSRVAASDREVASADVGEDSNVSVAGEEDPGAAVELIDPITHAPDAWCPWPGERSA